jgi:hypothetical protein
MVIRGPGLIGNKGSRVRKKITLGLLFSSVFMLTRQNRVAHSLQASPDQVELWTENGC